MRGTGFCHRQLRKTIQGMRRCRPGGQRRGGRCEVAKPLRGDNADDPPSPDGAVIGVVCILVDGALRLLRRVR